MTLAAKNLGTPDEKRSSEHGEMNVVTIAGTAIARAVFRPGWRWSADIGPSAGTGSCQVAHASYLVSGRFAVRMDDGTEPKLGPGDAHVVGPGHDAWVVGDEPCVIIDIALAPAAMGTRHRRAAGAVPPVRHRVPRPAPGSGRRTRGGRPAARQRLTRARCGPRAHPVRTRPGLSPSRSEAAEHQADGGTSGAGTAERVTGNPA